MIMAKVACFANGCCYGAVCSLPWAVTFPEGGTERTAPAGLALHPTQLYEILMLAVIAVFGTGLYWLSLTGLAIFADLDFRIALLIGFALAEATGLFGLLVALIILFG